MADYRYGNERDQGRGYGSASYGGGYNRDQDHDRSRYGALSSSDRIGRGGSSSYGHGEGSYGGRGDRDDYRGRQSGRDNDRYNNYDEDRTVAIDETSRLIASNKVEGTRVYNRRGDRLGTVHNFMVDKRSGRVEYAVMSFGGFLGLGERYYPLPWNLLSYDERYGGYVVDIDERELERAPSFRAGDEPRFDRAYGQHVYGYYGFPY